MREPLILAMAQPLCTPYHVEMNALAHAALIRAADARVIVFPELSLTGYELDAPTLDCDDPRLLPLVEACAETGSVALVGAPIAGEAKQPHIAILAVDGSGATVVYRKLWLGEIEAERFTPGSHPAVLDVDGWRLGLAICRDTNIPQHASDTVALGIDAYVAGVLETADRASFQEARAQHIASEYQVWVALASFAGSTGGGYHHSAGRSGIWSPAGSVVAQAGSETGAVVRATLR
jgi:predicted amidohydrolase